MIFYLEAAKDLAVDTYKNLTSVLVYKGNQPTVAEYVSKVNDGTFIRSGGLLLQGYPNIGLTVNQYGNSFRIEKISPAGTSYGDYMVASGIAEWAVLFHSAMLIGTDKLLEFNSSTNEINFLRDITEDDLLMIVPVTTTTEVSGVIRFESVDFDSSVNNKIEKYTLNLY
jgi:hypothetical protein